ncbi:MAG: hypothetical protein HC871_10805, partial [Rhizobiales bacterium]|nr:hypothetical protein [Hyphomicrobiales bacterium]
MNDIALPRPTEAAGVGPDRPKGLSDDALLELVQRQTFRFFWDGAHPVSGLARDRTNVQDKSARRRWRSAAPGSARSRSWSPPSAAGSAGPKPLL